jgi:hypothetical protein
MNTSEIVFIHNKLLHVSTTHVAIFREEIRILNYDFIIVISYVGLVL